MLAAETITQLHDRLTEQWHAASPAETQLASSDWLQAVRLQHQANFELWHLEDEARTPGAGDAVIADVKRRIDTTNQRRNDLVEELDRTLLAWLNQHALPLAGAELHSETPGLIIDRLSILALKMYHTREEVQRSDALASHIDRNRARLDILAEQRTDLANCLNALWRDTLAGTRRFKLYRQLKMYNDPSLNPAVYKKQA